MVDENVMASAGIATRRLTVSPAAWDTVMVSIALVQAFVIHAIPLPFAIGLGVWWNANTISHNFIHRPFFRRRVANHFFAAYLSLLLGFPHQLWRERHLAHHAGVPFRWRLNADLLVQSALVALLWVVMAVRAPGFLISAYLPGFAAGLSLCALHGYYEHARGTTSYYGRLYNALCFNDGFHVEHHAFPGAHWSTLPELGRSKRRPYASEHPCSAPNADDRNSTTSEWPAPLRWMELVSLESLERLALWFEFLQRFMLSTHRRALSTLVDGSVVSQVAIVGGGLFPRTALILRELLPHATITIIDHSRRNVMRAQTELGGGASAALTRAAVDIAFVCARYPDVDLCPFDLVVFPLSFDGVREELYQHPPARAVIVHDWIWRRRGTSRIVSPMLLKRVNLVRS